MIPIDLSQKTALVTGASRGIGAAIAMKLARAGARVAIHYSASQDAAKTVAGAIEKSGGPSPVCVRGDLCHPEERQRIYEEAVVGLGAIDILVNNAGVFERNPIGFGAAEDFLDRWQRTMSVNIDAAAHLTHLCLPGMRERRHGRIVMVSSRAAFRGEVDCPDYAVSKASMVNLARCLARSEGPYGITANSVCPGWTMTDMAAADLEADGDAIVRDIPLGRVASPKDIAGAVLFYVSDLGSYATGTALALNGGSFLH